MWTILVTACLTDQRNSRARRGRTGSSVDHRFSSKTLQGLSCGGNSFLTGGGMTHIGTQAMEEFIDGRIEGKFILESRVRGIWGSS
jgi:hypothetical protein